MNLILELIDEATGQVFAQSEAPLESLPKAFAGMETKLNVAGADYHVVEADCATHDEMAKRGKVRLTLRKVGTVDPKSILFSLPSLENEVPNGEPIPPRADVRALLSEDDYRQIEFVHQSRKSDIEAEFRDIQLVITRHQRGPGFSLCHVRKLIRSPLGDARISIVDLESALGIKRRPFAFKGKQEMVRAGFAMPGANAVVYGLEDNGVATVLALHGAVVELAPSLQSIAETNQLLFVDWNKTEQHSPKALSALGGVRGMELDSRFRT